MNIQVDARRHLSQPGILLRNNQTGEVLIYWSHATIQRWLADGDICYKDARPKLQLARVDPGYL